MPTDADAYQRLARALDAHRGDADAYRRLGAQLTARRHALDPRYGNRRLFVRERLVPLGLKETAAYKLVYDLERGELQGRAGYSAGNILALADAYGITQDAVIAVLDGGALEPPQPVTLPRPRPEPVRPQLDFTRIDPALKPYIQDVLKNVYQRIGFPPDAGPGRELPELPEDAGRLPGSILFTSDREAGFWDDPRVLTVGEKVRSIALMRKISAEWSEKRRKTG